MLLRFREHITSRCALLGLFPLGILLGYLAWNLIRVPFANPEAIASSLSLAKFNPINNLLRFTAFVVTPALLLGTVTFLTGSEPSRLDTHCCCQDEERAGDKTGRIPFWLAISGSVGFAFSALSNFFCQPFAPTLLDFYHEGECLTPAYTYMAGNGAWSGSFVIHGGGYDIFRTVLAWWIFGAQSIGAHRVAFELLQWTSHAAVVFLLLCCFTTLNRGKEKGSSLLFLALMLSSYVVLRYPWPFLSTWEGHHVPFIYTCERDIPYLVGFGFLILALCRRSRSLFFCAGLMSPAAFFWSIDKGAFYTALSCLSCLFLFLYREKESRDYTARTGNFSLISFLALGCLTGWAALVVIFGWREMAAMLSTTFHWLKWKDLLDSYIYPHPLNPVGRWWWRYNLPLILGSLYLFWTVWMRSFLLRSENRDTALIWVLFVASGIFYYRYALGRSDLPHLTSGSLFMYLSAPILVWIGTIQCGSLRRRIHSAWGNWLAAGVIVAIGFGSSILMLRHWQAIWDSPARIARLVTLEDSAYLDQDRLWVLHHIKDACAEDEWTYVHTSGAAWYYLLRQPPKARFCVTYYATPKAFQIELLEALKSRPPKYVLYSSPMWYDRVDNIAKNDRFPLLEEWLLQNYADYASRNGWVIKKATALGHPSSIR